MDYLIAPTLFQQKSCRLPGIGTLSVITGSATTDFINTEINAPTQTIVFSAAQDDEEKFNEFTALSELIKKDLSEKGTVHLKGIGDFKRNNTGLVTFIPISVNRDFAVPVRAERVIRQDAEHTMLVGDKETTNTVMTGYFVEEGEVVTKSKWWIWAIVLGIIGLAVIAIYASQNGFNALGNTANYNMP